MLYGYGINLDEDDEQNDIEYVPSKKEEEQYEKDQKIHKQSKRRNKKDINELWEEMNKP